MSTLLRDGVRYKMYKVVNSEKLASLEGEPSVLQLPNNVATFLAKLWTIVNDPKTNNLICWSTNGRSFIIKDQARFAKELLPHYYKHNHMASFVRQLNMYGFHKKVSVELGGLKCDKDEMEFAHQYFCRGHAFLLSQIKRKIANNKNQSQDTQIPLKSELMSKMMTDIKCMQERQGKFDDRLGVMKDENKLLWQELVLLRQKHMQQQKIVNKLIHFLVTLVQSGRSGLTVKRRLYHPLMIDHANRQPKKRKLEEPQVSPTGPVIHELDGSEPGLDSEYIVDDMMENEDPAVQSPESTDDYSKEDIHLITDPAYMVDEIEIPGPSEVDEIEIPGPSEVGEIEILGLSGANKTRISGSPEAHNDRMYTLLEDAEQKTLDKKTRKTKVPVKILIPPLENGEQPREEYHLLDMPVGEEAPATITLLNNESIGSRPVPVATVRSSKLAAMAATMKKSQQDTDQEIDTETSVDDDISDNDTASLVKLEDILTVPNVPNNNNTRNNIEYRINTGFTPKKVNKGFNHVYGGKSILKSNSNRNWHEENAAVKSSREDKANCIAAGTSSSKDLSLSCVNPTATPEANYRLNSIEELNNHLDKVDGDLKNFHGMLQRNYESFIDVKTLFELFEPQNELLSLSDLPINQELNPEMNCEKEENNYQLPESMDGLNGGELTTYNPPNSFDFFDFDLASSSLLSPETTNVTEDPVDPDPLHLEDKSSILDDFPRKDTNSRS